MNSINHFDRFPNEVLASIFKLLSFPRTISLRHDLHSCVLVNRQWHNVAMPVLWHTLHLDDDGNKVKDIESDPTRTGNNYMAISDDQEDQGIADDWEGWLDYENSASPTTDCWGDTSPRPDYANMLGVRPCNLDLLFRSAKCLSQQSRASWATYDSPFGLCRKITVSFLDHSQAVKNKKRISFIILACKNLLDFDMFLHLQNAPTRKEKNAWTILARHLSSQLLRTLRIRVKWGKDDVLPISFTPAESSTQLSIPFDILQNRLTHLSLELDQPLEAVENEPNFSNFETLRFFAIYICPDCHFEYEEPEPISRWLQSVQVEEMGISWPMYIGALSVTLTKLSIIKSKNTIPVMLIVKQLVNLEVFTVKDSQHLYDNSETVQPIQNHSVENEVIGCRRLRVLHLNDMVPKFFFQVISSQYVVDKNLILWSHFPIFDYCDFILADSA